jgi:hypothetical protein
VQCMNFFFSRLSACMLDWRGSDEDDAILASHSQ